MPVLNVQEMKKFIKAEWSAICRQYPSIIMLVN
jgi:hypothetical protein